MCASSFWQSQLQLPTPRFEFEYKFETRECRIVEPASGSIVLDGVDVTSIGLLDLRSKLSLVPQDPVIFSGSVRANLDPFNGSLDGEVWAALKQSGLQEAVMAMPVRSLPPTCLCTSGFSTRCQLLRDRCSTSTSMLRQQKDVG
jgi:ABC-type multidrug transport system fused ATPase/permease subunit